MIGISIRGVTKRFGPTLALDRIGLDIAPGELFFLLGPSGCGKTTLLRTIAGFTQPDEGAIFFGEQDVTHLPIHQRRTGMVFQNYALWPHKTVAGNVAFGLEEARTPKAEIARRVEEALAATQMEGYADRHIHQLSGGQQQRVALARALVIRPRCLLLDEPLSNLDARLRLEMRTEIRRICREAGLTAIYVTHDQKEALSIADRIAIFRTGELCQVGTPREVYRHPASPFVADFVGETNFLPAQYEGRTGERFRFTLPGGVSLESTQAPATLTAGDAVTLSIRPEALRLTAEGPLTGQLQETTYLGEIAQHQFRTPAGTLRVSELNPGPPPARTALSVGPEEVIVFPSTP